MRYVQPGVVTLKFSREALDHAHATTDGLHQGRVVRGLAGIRAPGAGRRRRNTCGVWAAHRRAAIGGANQPRPPSTSFTVSVTGIAAITPS